MGRRVQQHDGEQRSEPAEPLQLGATPNPCAFCIFSRQQPCCMAAATGLRCTLASCVCTCWQHCSHAALAPSLIASLPPALPYPRRPCLCAVLQFELPHFAVELVIILPCVQILCSRMKVLAMPSVNAALPPRRDGRPQLVREEYVPNVLRGCWERQPAQRHIWQRIRCAGKGAGGRLGRDGDGGGASYAGWLNVATVQGV